MNNQLIKYDIESSQALANSLMKKYAKSFYFASSFLSKDKRKDTELVYAFCRYVDNIIDNPRQRTILEKKNELSQIEEELKLAYHYGESEHPIIKGFIYSALKYKIPIEYPIELIKGVLMDEEQNRYNDFDELYLFCYRVASVVGLMMTYVFGFKGNETLKNAEYLGIAMQLTNILRDIEEDSLMNRIYLPKNELDEYGIYYEDIFNKNFTEKFKEFMKFQINRASEYYNLAEPGIKNLDKQAQFAIYSASRIYSQILKKIKENDYNPFLGRVYITKAEKFKIILKEKFFHSK